MEYPHSSKQTLIQPANTASPSLSTYVESPVPGQQEIIYYGASVDDFNDYHERLIRSHTKKILEVLREKLLEDIEKFPVQEQIPFRNQLEKDLTPIEEHMYTKMSEEFNAVTAKYMRISPNVLLPGFEDFFRSMAREKIIERELTAKWDELMLVNNQQQVMKQKLKDEISTIAQLSTDADIDMALCDLLEEFDGDLSDNGLSAVIEALTKTNITANEFMID